MATRLLANRGNGTCVSTTDPFTPVGKPIDVVLVPGPGGKPQEVKCVNVADLGDAIGVVPTVCVNKVPVVVSASVIPTSSGAPPNAIKGVASPPPANNTCTFVTSAPTVFAGGLPVIRHRDTTAQDAGNCPGAVKLSDAFSVEGKSLRIDPNLTPEEKEAIVSELEELDKTPRGHELLKRMQDTKVMQGHKVTISLVPDPTAADVTSSALAIPEGNIDRFMTFAPGSLSEVVPGKGSNTTIAYNPSQATRLGLPGAIIMGHELIHALHNATGTAQIGAATLAGGAETAHTELQAIGIDQWSSDRFTENVLRRERGLPPRLGHDGKGVDRFEYKPEKGSVPPEGARTGAAGNGLVYVK